MMSILGIIPARYASTRFPGKPMADINGRSMILRVYDQAKLSGIFQDILVATDDDRILNHVVFEGYNAVLTSQEHRSGTDRCLEALEKWENLKGTRYNYVINIQGDEPFIHPDQIRDVASLLTSGNASIATLAKPTGNREEILNPNVVKVVFDKEMNALYFSRSPIPFIKETGEVYRGKTETHYKHVGIYGFDAGTLRTACRLPEGVLEKHESLEQLRWLEAGIQIKIGITNHENISIDAPEDLLKITNKA